MLDHPYSMDVTEDTLVVIHRMAIGDTRRFRIRYFCKIAVIVIQSLCSVVAEKRNSVFA